MEDKTVNSFSQNMYKIELVKYYDLMHKHRNYDQESNFADQVVQKLWPEANKILDIGCGTGEHAIRMAQRGYKVTCVDTSQDMLKLAREKANKAGVSIDFRCKDLGKLDFNEEFQAAYCLGYTFLYLTTHSEVKDFLKNINRALFPSGILLIDFLNGWSLIEKYPKDKFVYRDGQTTIFQFNQASLDKRRRVRHIEFFYVIKNGSGEVKIAFTEEDLRIFFEDEVLMFMASHGFEALKVFGGYSMDSAVTDSSCVIVVVGRKKRK